MSPEIVTPPARQNIATLIGIVRAVGTDQERALIGVYIGSPMMIRPRCVKLHEVSLNTAITSGGRLKSRVASGICLAKIDECRVHPIRKQVLCRAGQRSSGHG